MDCHARASVLSLGKAGKHDGVVRLSAFVPSDWTRGLGNGLWRVKKGTARCLRKRATGFASRTAK
jgi:hypothetical protein